MEAYSDFATVYDTFMDETPYDVWGDFIDELIRKYGVSKVYDSDNDETKDTLSDKTNNDDGSTDSSNHDYEEAIDEERNLVVELGCGTGSFTQVMKQKGKIRLGLRSHSKTGETRVILLVGGIPML